MNRLASALALTLVLTIAPFLYGGSATSETDHAPIDDTPVAAAPSNTQGGPIEQVLKALCEAAFGHGDETSGDPPEDCTTQYDGRSHGDAADHCNAAAKILPVNDTSSTPFTGLLVPREDERDHYLVRESAHDREIVITLTAQPGLQTRGLLDASGISVLPHFTVTVYAKSPAYGCAEAVAFAEQEGKQVLLAFHAQPETQYVVGVERMEGGLGPLTESEDNRESSNLQGSVPLERDACHGVCIGTLNDMAGYRLEADAQ